MNAAAKTPTVTIRTHFWSCLICSASRRTVEAIECHMAFNHEDEIAEGTEARYMTLKTSTYGQPASFPVPAGDVVVG